MNEKYIYLKSFVSGFLYVFGLSKNPSSILNTKYREQNDINEMEKDWQNIGSDIQKSYEQYRAETGTS